MSVWMVRAGKHGENEATALEHGLVTIGWNELPDLSHITSREEMTEFYREHHPDDSPALVANQVEQLWAFCHRIQIGDLAMIPLKTQSAIAIGRVTGPYRFRTDLSEGVRLWDSADLLAAIIRNYAKLPDELQAELLLKRIWALVLED